MLVRVLGCSGAISYPGHTTAFLVDDDILIDAGTGVGRLSQVQLARIDHVFLTHAHMDHIAALPLLVDAVGGLRTRPLTVHALASTIEALQRHIFNGVIWPDFCALPTPKRPYLRFAALTVGQQCDMGQRRVRVLPATHSQPAVGYAVSPLPRAAFSGPARPAWVFAGDSQIDALFWQHLNQIEVAHLVVDIAFSDRHIGLACASGHLSPSLFAHRLEHMAPGSTYPIHVSHAKPAEVEAILAQIIHMAAESRVHLHGMSSDRIRALHEDQVFTLE